ncbi:MAG TPA: citrate/2-methylcitrate synthase, partial [Kofleriaceae bacterium]|nr:citrate/2-methylcitrate synthase [Kofleriaceae bacterium]
SGRRHGSAAEAIARHADELGSPERAVRAARALRDAPPGFGHQLYPAGDPRTAPLLDLARSSANKRARTLVALADAAAARDFYPSVDVGLAALVAALGLAPSAGSGLFAVARSAGWLAHVLEQRTQSYVLRPRARYVGVATP